jgi:hypothetical protein
MRNPDLNGQARGSTSRDIASRARTAVHRVQDAHNIVTDEVALICSRMTLSPRPTQQGYTQAQRRPGYREAIKLWAGLR